MKFQVFKNGRVADNFDLTGAYLFGSDSIAIHNARISFKKGIIECRKSNLQTAGLAVLWPVEGFGRLLLPTACLPEREKPYNLNVEIARGKLMQIVTKREDWALFEADINEKSKTARDLFIQAIQELSDMPGSSKLADRALTEAMLVAEDLTLRYAETLFDLRLSSRGFGRGCLGCKINPHHLDKPGYLEKLLELFSSIMVPVSWAEIEREQGKYDFSLLDSCVEALSKERIAIIIGPLLCFEKSYLPHWLISGRKNFEKIREHAYKFVTDIIQRYSDRVHNWIVISGANCHNYFGFDFERILEITRASCMAAKAASDRARKIIEIQQPWGEYYATNSATIPPLVYIDMTIQSGVNFDAFALQIDFSQPDKGSHLRDMMQISSLLDTLAVISKPFWITGVTAPTGIYSSDNHSQSIWDQTRQKQWLERFYKIILSKPFVDGIIYSDSIETADETQTSTALLAGNLEPRETFKTLKDLQKTIFSRQS